tara:strand:+ start:379 stop:894 length:516 start_codon:yes stop_codon:yes gene_type:complete
MDKTNEKFLDGPIPGMSLTAEPKSRPWRRPSQFNTVDEAVAMYSTVFKDKTTKTMLLEQIENGIPLTSIADLLISANTMQGKHTLDVGILVSPILVETMITFADLAEIDYVIGTEGDNSANEKEEMIRRAVKSAGKLSEEDLSIPTEIDEGEPAEEQEPPTGIMAPRRGTE